MTVIDDEPGDAILPTEGNHFLGVGGVVGRKEIHQPGLKFGPVTPAPGVGQFIGGKGPAAGKGGDGVHQVGVAGDEGILGRRDQGGIDGPVGRVIFEADPVETPGAQARHRHQDQDGQMAGPALNPQCGLEPQSYEQAIKEV